MIQVLAQFNTEYINSIGISLTVGLVFLGLLIAIMHANKKEPDTGLQALGAICAVTFVGMLGATVFQLFAAFQ